MRRKTPDNEFTKRSRDRICNLIDEFCNGKQVEFCKKTGIPKGTVSHYVNGGNIPSDENIRIIADTFNVNPLWVRGYDIDRDAPENLRLLKTSAEWLDSNIEQEEMIFANVLDASGYRLESSEYRGVYVVSRFPDGTIVSKESITISSEELNEFTEAITEYADFLMQKKFKNKNINVLMAAHSDNTSMEKINQNKDLMEQEINKRK